MQKRTLGVKPMLYPMPVVVVGAKVGERVNYMVAAYVGLVQHEPPMLALSLNRTHFTNVGIKENGAFSLNIPSVSQAQLVDHVGIVSGRSVDKSDLFTTFYGELGNAPMARECPVNIELKLVQTLDLEGPNEVFIGQVVQTYASERVLKDGVPDIAKLSPIVFSIHDNTYWKVGDLVGRAWDIGREMHAPRD